MRRALLLSGLLLGLSAYGLGGCGESRPGDQPFFDVPAPDTSAPVEDDAKGWVEHLFRLQERVARVRQQKELWNMTDDKRH